MAIPSLFDLTLPVLQLAAEREISYVDAADRIADRLGIPDQERSELLASGTQTKLANRIRWAKVELGMAGLVENTKTGHFQATAEGRSAVTTAPARIDRSYLMQFDTYRRSTERSKEKVAQARSSMELPSSDGDPISIAENAIAQINVALGDDVIRRVVELPPVAFELLII